MLSDPIAPPTGLSSAQRGKLISDLTEMFQSVDPDVVAKAESANRCGIAEVHAHLEPLVAIVLRTTADQIEPYLYQVMEDICSRCSYCEPSSYCPVRWEGRCVFFQHMMAMVPRVKQSLAKMGVSSDNV